MIIYVCQLSEKTTLDEIAKELNMSKRNLQRTLRIERNLTENSLYTGEIQRLGCFGVI